MRKILLLLTISILAIAIVACGADPTPTPAPTAVPEQPTDVPPTEEPPAEPTEDVPTEVTGEIMYKERIALPDDAVVNVQIQNISLMDAPAEVMGEQTYITEGKQVPLPFSVPYNPDDIEENIMYGLSIRIEAADGTLLFINDTAIPVITNGNPTSDIVADVIMVGSAEPVEAASQEVTGEIVYRERIALPDDAVVQVQIQNISLADAPAEVIGEQTYVTEGQQVPLPFTVPYNTADIQENIMYGLSIRIEAADGTLLFINDTAIPVITNDNPTSDIVVDVIMVNSPAAGGEDMSMVDENTIVLSPDMVSLDTQGLPYSYQPVYVAESPYDASMPPGPVGLPAHIEILFGVTDPADRQPNDPIMYIIPVEAYEAMWEDAGSDSVTLTMDQIALQTYLLPQPASTSGMPALPYEEVVGANDVSVQVGRAVSIDDQTDEMATKNGYRFVGRWGQSPNPVTNQNLRYVYQGFTNDGSYLVSFFYPVTTDQLPAESADLSQEEMDAFTNDMEAAMAESADALNALTADAWQPDLTTLDAVVQSLQITDMPANGLVDKTFQWNGEMTDPSTGEMTTMEQHGGEYSLTFYADGTFSGVSDCNNIAGSVTISGGIVGSIAFESGISTAAACDGLSLDTGFQGLLAATQSYKVALGGNQMSLSMPAGGGDYLFEAVPPKTAVVSEASQPIARVVDRQLQWITFFDAVEGEQTIPNPEQYQLLLNEDGTVNVQADCNMMLGSYTVDGSSIEFTFGPSTLVACPEDSLADQYIASLTAVRIFFNQDGDVFFDLFADGGTMQFTDVGSTGEETEAPADEENSGAEEVSDATIDLSLQGLADSYSWEVIPAVPASPGPGGIGSPAYVVVTFNDATVTETLDTNAPRITIYPIEAYINVAGDSVAAQVDQLNTLLELGDGVTPEPETAMPLLPPPGSFMNRWVQYLKLGFTQGEGVRYISDSPYRQAFGVWANDTTGYYYQALTEDGRFYISLFWPVSTDTLPNTADEADEGMKAEATNPETNAAYQEAIRASLNELSASDWTPNLDDLDALAASIEFTP